MKSRMKSFVVSCLCLCDTACVLIFYAMYDVGCVVYGDDASYFSSYLG
jgi:hypothetical protein